MAVEPIDSHVSPAKSSKSVTSSGGVACDSPSSSDRPFREPNVVLALGDSHTACTYGADWVTPLRKQLALSGLQLQQHGGNGETAGRIAARLPPLLRKHGGALAAVILLAGSNDVMAATTRTFADFQQNMMGVKERPTKEAWLSTMDSMLEQVAESAPGCRVAVVTLPPVGEALDDLINTNVAEWNDALRALVARHSNAELVEFAGACKAHLTGIGGSAKPLPDYLVEPSLRGLWNLFHPRLQRLLWRSWDAIGARKGLHLHTDHIHLNDTAAALLGAELQPFVARLQQAAGKQ